MSNKEVVEAEFAIKKALEYLNMLDDEEESDDWSRLPTEKQQLFEDTHVLEEVRGGECFTFP